MITVVLGHFYIHTATSVLEKIIKENQSKAISKQRYFQATDCSSQPPQSFNFKAAFTKKTSLWYPIPEVLRSCTLPYTPLELTEMRSRRRISKHPVIRELTEGRTFPTCATFVLAFKLTYICNLHLPVPRCGVTWLDTKPPQQRVTCCPPHTAQGHRQKATVLLYWGLSTSTADTLGRKSVIYE